MASIPAPGILPPTTTSSSREDDFASSPFSMLNKAGRHNSNYNSRSRSRSGDDQPGFILRTRSLDEQRGAIEGKRHGYEKSTGGDEDEEEEHADHSEEAVYLASSAPSAGGALHSSLDAVAMLQDRRRGGGSPFFSDEDDDDDDDDEKDTSNLSESWCDEDYSDGGDGELSGRKHLRPKPAFETAAFEANPPGTVRKQPRRTATATVNVPAKTPVRPRLRPPGAMKKSAGNHTPSSAAKRRRAHWQEESTSNGPFPPTTPFHPALLSPPTNSSATSAKLDSSIFATYGGLHGTTGGSTFSPIPQPPPAFTPKRQTSGPFGTANSKSMSKWHNTGTTAASTALLETTLESSSDSVDTSSPTTTRFRFTSFPASLPRVNIPRSRECPDSLRKRIPFAEPGPGAATAAAAATASSSLLSLSDVNQSREDDGTQNTSISSLSAEGHHQHLAPAPGAYSYPPTLLHLQPSSTVKAKAPQEDQEEEEDHYEINTNRPIHAKLFEEDEIFGYSDDDEDNDDDDDTESSPVGDRVGRTRLDFNNALTPHKDGFPINRGRTTADLSDAHNNHNNDHTNHMDLTHPYDQRRINSFPSSLSSHNTHMNNLSGCEVIDGGSSTPARQSSSSEHHYGLPVRTLTPREVQLHFPLEEDYSPIPGFKEDAGRCEMHESLLPSNLEHSGGTAMLSDPPPANLLPRHTKKTDATVSSKKSSSSSGNSNSSDDHSNRMSMKEESSSTGSGSATGSKSRRLRPMPDMSAFESGQAAAMMMSSSRGDRSSDDGSRVTLDSKGLPTTAAQRLTCPPTPVRTPAWANEGGALARFGRQSSLITTKVLLSVPSQVVEGRCSLENSVLVDDDSKASGSRFSRANSNQHSSSWANGGGTYKGDMATLVAPKFNPGGTQQGEQESASKVPKLHAPPRLTRRVPPGQEVDSVISFSKDFETICVLGSGAFADVYKVRSVRDNRMYAVKRNRRQFRGKRDRDMALAEVQAMQRLESVNAETGGGNHSSSSSNGVDQRSYCLYLLFFYRAWQEDGYFFCQTELCCRDTCREFLDSSRFLWNTAKNRYPSLRRHLQSPGETIMMSSPSHNEDEAAAVRVIPNDTVWKICHDITAGLSHIHSHGMVHHDIKPSNIFFVPHPRFGAMCKIGDFGMAGEIGSSADGLEGDTRYMPPELLALGARHPSADIFSLGLTIYEIATDQTMAEMPSEGPQWHFLRSSNGPTLPSERGDELLKLVQAMTDPNETKRPTADRILTSQNIIDAGHGCDHFLRDYIHDIEAYDRMEEERLAMDSHEDQTPRNSGSHRSAMPIRSPSLSMLMSNPPNLLSPVAKYINS